MKRILILVAAMLLVAGVAYGASVVGSAHDMRGYVVGETTTQVCVFCHTPHQSTTANEQDPLWNHSVTAQTVYNVYGSDTFNATVIDIGTGNVGPGVQNTSLLCMGCHDGTVAVNALYKTPTDGNAGTLLTISNGALLGTDLSDDHPINFTYDAALVTADTAGSGVPGLYDPSTLTGVKLIDNKLQCASCHNVHDPAITPFLRVDNANSDLCLTCHIK